MAPIELVLRVAWHAMESQKYMRMWGMPAKYSSAILQLGLSSHTSCCQIQANNVQCQASAIDHAAATHPSSIGSPHLHGKCHGYLIACCRAFHETTVALTLHQPCQIALVEVSIDCQLSKGKHALCTLGHCCCPCTLPTLSCLCQIADIIEAYSIPVIESLKPSIR